MNRQKRNILNDLFEDWKNGKGIFYYLEQLEIPEAEPQIPWKDAIDGILLDWEYHGNRSGSKIISPLLSRIVTETGLSDEQKEQIAALLWYKFRKQWTALWATTTATYNPIENYSMTEHRTHGDQQDGTNGTDTDTTNRIRGFNSSTDVDSDSSEAHADGEQHLTTNGYEDVTRSGNIGVTTSQQMLQSERDLWDWNFFDQVFKDIDSILIIPEYGCPGDGIYYTPGSGYVLPVATAAVLGGVKATAKTTETGEIAVDADGKLWYVPGSDYVLPVATASVLGGVKAKAKTTETGEIAVDADGKLWYVPGQGDAPVQSVNGMTGAVVLDNEDVGAPSQTAFTALSSDVEGNTEDIGDLMEAVPFRFGVDSQGNYGYYKAGADTVTPFKTGGSGTHVYSGTVHSPTTNGTVFDVVTVAGTVKEISIYQVVEGTSTYCFYSYLYNYISKLQGKRARDPNYTSYFSQVNTPDCIARNKNPTVGGIGGGQVISIFDTGLIKSITTNSQSGKMGFKTDVDIGYYIVTEEE